MAHRIERVNSLIRQELSNLLQSQVKDPRLGSFIAITGVSTSSDLKHARIFVSHMGIQAEKQETLDVLATASGFLRRELGKNLKLRYTPELNFQWDDSIEHGDYLLQLIDRFTPD
ncbi:MAG: 30S ribosome-binding factor RbfA [Dehalococcoidales bacterium]|nr:MAG: 30S ribosome-binding factor RbfA [Dehalococcoidales bacterium]